MMVITGLGLVAPGAAGPADALRPAAAPGTHDIGNPWFELKTALPGRGYKRLPPGCQYLLAAARAALTDAGDCLTGVAPQRRAAVVGTNNACAPVLDEMDRIIMGPGAAELSPTTSPFMAMSLFASRLSTEHGLHGFNLTANSPGTAGLEALGIGARALAAGRADLLLIGAVEDVPPGPRPGPGGDLGAVTLICEPAEAAAARGARVRGTCRVRGASLDPDDLADAAAVLDELWPHELWPHELWKHELWKHELWKHELWKHGDPDRIDSVLDDSAVGKAVASWLAGRAARTEQVTVPAVTDGGCLAPLRRVVGLLHAAPDRPSRRLVVTASAQGNVALAALTVLPHPT